MRSQQGVSRSERDQPAFYQNTVPPDSAVVRASLPSQGRLASCSGYGTGVGRTCMNVWPICINECRDVFVSEFANEDNEDDGFFR